MNKFVETSSLWGNNYRRRYYVNGKRVSEGDFDCLKDRALASHPHAGMSGKSERTSYGYRTTWEGEAV